MSSGETSLIEYDELCFIDFDRTLARTDKLAECLLEAVGVSLPELNEAEIAKEREEIEVSGGSFDAIGYLINKIGEDKVLGLKPHFLSLVEERRKSQSEDSFFEPGAEDLLAVQPEAVIMTTGGDLWQSWKLEAMGLHNHRTIITGRSDKGAVLADHFKNSEFIFEFEDRQERIVTKKVILIDDKFRSFKGLPEENALGLWYLPQGRITKPSQRPEIGDKLPANIVTIRELGEVTMKIAFKEVA